MEHCCAFHYYPLHTTLRSTTAPCTVILLYLFRVECSVEWVIVKKVAILLLHLHRARVRGSANEKYYSGSTKWAVLGENRLFFLSFSVDSSAPCYSKSFTGHNSPLYWCGAVRHLIKLMRCGTVPHKIDAVRYGAP